MELTIKIKDEKSHEALLHFLHLQPNEYPLKSELDEWQATSHQNFSKAYSKDEPEYSVTLVKEPNPFSEGR
ncbi:MAG: hypothetical protein ORN54_06770 [Cyclobacteriaceae bacterium]|nr:hypothetical protein [Cyclobacteriaceae bacterium]